MSSQAQSSTPSPGLMGKIGSDLWKFFTSIRLAIVLIALIALVGLIGTFFPQADKTRSVDYIEQYGLETYRLIQTFQLDTIFSSTYFLFILSVFFVNMGACTIKRLKASFRYSKLKQTVMPPQAFERMAVSETVENISAENNLLDTARSTLRKKHYHVQEVKGQLLAEKFRWERFGIDVFHIGIMVLLVGGMMTFVLGDRYFQVAHEGEEFVAPGGDFSVRVDKFWSENYAETERVMDWHTTLTVLEEGQEIKTETVQVNVPMYHKGIHFFQSSFGQDWEEAAEVKVRIESADGTNLGEYQAALNENVPLGDTGLRLNVFAFLPDWALTENQVAYSRSQKLNNPGAFLRIYDEDDQLVHQNWAFSQPNMQLLQDTVSPERPFRLYLIGMNAPEFTGIQVNYDPGYNVAIAGFVLMMAGILVHLYFTHKQIWVFVDTAEQKLYVGGKARHHSKGFETEFEQLVKQFKPAETS